MKHYWENLSQREQRLVLLGIGGIIIWLVYFGLFLPLSRGIATHEAQLVEAYRTEAVLRQALPERKILTQQKALPNGELPGLITRQLQTGFKDFPCQTERNANGEIKLTFEQIPYNRFIIWLLDFSKQYRVTIKQLQIEHSKTSGVVKLSLTLQ